MQLLTTTAASLPTRRSTWTVQSPTTMLPPFWTPSSPCAWRKATWTRWTGNAPLSTSSRPKSCRRYFSWKLMTVRFATRSCWPFAKTFLLTASKQVFVIKLFVVKLMNFTSFYFLSSWKFCLFFKLFKTN